MQEYKIGYSRVNSLLINLSPNTYTRTWYLNSNKRYYLNFYDYLLSQIEYFVLGDIFQDRKLDDYKKAVDYIESFVSNSPHRDIYENRSSFIKTYSYFLADVSALLLIFNEENSFEIVPTLPLKLLENFTWEEKLKFERNEENTEPRIFRNRVFNDYRKELINQLENPRENIYNITYILTEIFANYQKVLELDVLRIIQSIESYEDRYGFSVIKAFIYRLISHNNMVCFVDERR